MCVRVFKVANGTTNNSVFVLLWSSKEASVVVSEIELSSPPREENERMKRSGMVRWWAVEMAADTWRGRNRMRSKVRHGHGELDLQRFSLQSECSISASKT